MRSAYIPISIAFALTSFTLAKLRPLGAGSMSPRTRIRIRSTAPLDGPTPSHRYAILPGRATAFAQQNIRHSASSAYHAHSLSAGQSLQKGSYSRSQNNCLGRNGFAPFPPGSSRVAVDKFDSFRSRIYKYIVSLDRLMRFGAPPLTPSKIVESAELTRNELSQRLQRRVNCHWPSRMYTYIPLLHMSGWSHLALGQMA
jgi:hypothetical protein